MIFKELSVISTENICPFLLTQCGSAFALKATYMLPCTRGS